MDRRLYIRPWIILIGLIVVFVGGVMLRWIAINAQVSLQGDNMHSRGDIWEPPPLPLVNNSIRQARTPINLVELQEVEKKAVNVAKQVLPTVVTVTSPTYAEEMKQGKPLRGVGSGVIVSADGMVLSKCTSATFVRSTRFF